MAALSALHDLYRRWYRCIDAYYRNKDNVRISKFSILVATENISIRQLAEMLVHDISNHYPKYSDKAKSVKLVDMDAAYYAGYQDVRCAFRRFGMLRKAEVGTDYQHARWFAKN